MSAVLKRPLETALDRAWKRLVIELDRFERRYGKQATGTDARLEAAFEALREELQSC